MATEKTFTPDQIPGLRQAAEAMSGRVYDNLYDDGSQGKFIYKDEQLVPVDSQSIKNIVYKDEEYYDQYEGVYGTQKVGYLSGQSVIDQAMQDPLSWVSNNVNWSGLSSGGDFSALEQQMKFLKDNKYDLSSIPNQGAVNQFNLTKQILDQGTTSKWTGTGFGGPLENARAMGYMLNNFGVKDIKDFGKFNGVVSRQDQQVSLKDPADPSKGYVYQEIRTEDYTDDNYFPQTRTVPTGRTFDVPQDSSVRDVVTGVDDYGNDITQKYASIPTYGETFGNKVTKQSFVDPHNYNMAGGNIFSGTYAGHGRTNFGVQFAGDGTPYFYTQFGGDTSSMADIAPIISFLAVIPTPLQPFAQAANALIAIDSGNTLAGLAGLAGIPGVGAAASAAGLSSVVTAIQTANQVVNIANAIKTSNVMALASAAAGLTGASLGSITIGDTGLTVSDAMKAVNLVKAVQTGEPDAIFKATIGLGTSKTIQKALDNPTTTLNADGANVADLIDPNFVADLVNPDSDSFLGNSEESLGTVLAEAPNNVGDFDSVVSGLKDSESKYTAPTSDVYDPVVSSSKGLIDFDTGLPIENDVASSQEIADIVAGQGKVADLMSGPSADVAGGDKTFDLNLLENLLGRAATPADIADQIGVLDASKPLSEITIIGKRGDPNEDGSVFGSGDEDNAYYDPVGETQLGASSAEVGQGEQQAVGDALKATDQETQSDLEKEINLSKTGTEAGAGTEVNLSKEIENQQGVLDAAKGKLSEAKKEVDDQLDLAYLAKKAGDPAGQAEAENKVDKAKVVVTEQKAIIDSTNTVIKELKKEEVINLLSGDGNVANGVTALPPLPPALPPTETEQEKSDRKEAEAILAGFPDAATMERYGNDIYKYNADIEDEKKRLADVKPVDKIDEPVYTPPVVDLPVIKADAGVIDNGPLVGLNDTDGEKATDKEILDVVAGTTGGGDTAPGGLDTVPGGATDDKGVATADTLGGNDNIDSGTGSDTLTGGATNEDDLLGGTGGVTLIGVGDTRDPYTILTPTDGENRGNVESVVVDDDAVTNTAALGDATTEIRDPFTILTPTEGDNRGGIASVIVEDDFLTGGDKTRDPYTILTPTEVGNFDTVKNVEVDNGLGNVDGGGGGGGGTGTTVRRTATTAAMPFFLPEPPIVTSPSIFNDPVMRGALPDMPQETKFQGPLDQFLKLATESSFAPKPQQPQQAVNMNDRLTYPQGRSEYFSYGQQSEIDNNLFPQFGQTPTETPMGGALGFNQGGLAMPMMAAGGTRHGQYAGGGLNVVKHEGKHRVDLRKGDAVTGAGDGQSDDIPAMLADGEFVFPADVVAALGNGSTKAGSDKLYDMMHSIRSYHRAAKPKDLPPPAKKSPLDYLKGKKSTKDRS